MSDNYTFGFLALNQEGGSDKVWGWIRLRDDADYLYNFWGKRGKKLTWKRYPVDVSTRYNPVTWKVEVVTKLAHSSDLRTKGHSKLAKGYEEIDLAEIETMTPGFTDEFENQFVLAKLFEAYHGEK